MLEKAIALAATAHTGMKDKGGNPYILHPLRVMLSLDSEIAQICGVLHDVVEDTTFTLEDLRVQGIPEEVLVALDLLTKRPSEKQAEAYQKFIDRICASKNQLACRVKLADLRDNLDLSRIETPSAADFARLDRYRQAALRLGETLDGLKGRAEQPQPSHRLGIRAVGISQHHPEDYLGDALIGMEIVNHNEGFDAHDVRINIALCDVEGKIIAVVESGLECVPYGRTFFFGCHSTLSEPFDTYIATAYAREFHTPEEHTGVQSGVRCSNLSIRQGPYGKTRLTGMAASVSSKALDRIWLYFTFYRHGVIVGGTYSNLDSLYPKEQRAFDIDVPFEIEVDRIEYSFTCETAI